MAATREPVTGEPQGDGRPFRSAASFGNGSGALSASSLLAGYKSSLKPLAVEEPIDVGWHRLLAYGLAKALMPTPVSADAVTVFAILIGIASGVCIAVPFEHHMLWGAALCTLSAVFDCADGQLARMRKKSSNFGRMLDGFADLVCMVAIVGGTVIHLMGQKHPLWFWAVVVPTIPICTFHFGLYDHYKNVYLRFTEPTFREGEDTETAVARRREQNEQQRPGLVMRFVWWVYIYYVSSQSDFIHRVDPYTSTRLNLFPSHDPRTAEIYKRHALGPMRVWRTFFGLGTHVFTYSIFTALDSFEGYLLFRFVFLNLIGFGYTMWWQRRASKAAFEEMSLRLPDQRGWDGEPAAVT